MQTHFESSDSLCQFVSELGSGVGLVSFSCGKDSIASWLQMRRHFERIVPYYLYLVPGLEFIETQLGYFEAHFGQRIIRLPHPSLYRQLNNGVFQTPESLPVILDAGLPTFDFDDVNEIIRQDLSLPASAYCGVGVRSADSALRYSAVKRYGGVNHKRRTFYPVYDWNKARLVAELKAANIRLPIDYKIFGTSLDGIDYQFLEPIKRNFPRDYERILDFFPLAEVELARQAYRQGKRYAAS